MKKNEKDGFRKIRLFNLLILLLLTTLTLSISTYAWFTTNRFVKIDLLDVNVVSEGSIQISANGKDWKSILSVDDIVTAREDYPNSVNQLPASIEPVSTVGDIENGKMKMFYGTLSNSNGNFVLDSSRSIETESFGADSKGKFVAFDIFLKTNQDASLYLSTESKITGGGEISSGIENSARVSFINEGNVNLNSTLNQIQNVVTNSKNDVYIWEPNYNRHTDYGILNAENVYGITNANNGERILYDGVSSVFPKTDNIIPSKANSNYYPDKFAPVNINFETISDFDKNIQLFELNKGITKFRIYMWIEGQDVDCEDNAAIGNVSFNLNLTSNPS